MHFLYFLIISLNFQVFLQFLNNCIVMSTLYKTDFSTIASSVRQSLYFFQLKTLHLLGHFKGLFSKPLTCPLYFHPLTCYTEHIQPRKGLSFLVKYLQHPKLNKGLNQQ